MIMAEITGLRCFNRWPTGRWLLLLAFLAILFLISFHTLTNSRPVRIPTRAQRYDPRNKLVQHVFGAIPNGFGDHCEELFSGDAVEADYTKQYKDGITSLNERIATIPDATPEGSSGTLMKQSLMLHYLAQAPGVRTVCETGFNVGYSSFGYLTANPNITVHSFDLNQYPGTAVMVAYLKGIYGKRLQLHFGDSTQTLPAVHREHPEIKCDLIYVDGGHFDEVPFADISNFITKYATPYRSLLVFDDFPSMWSFNKAGVLSSAWGEAVHTRLLAELFRCTFKKTLRIFQRGFAVGLVTRKTQYFGPE